MIINHTFNIWVHFASSGFQNTYIILHPLQQIKAKCTLSLSIFVATHFRLQCEVIISYRFISVIYIYIIPFQYIPIIIISPWYPSLLYSHVFSIFSGPKFLMVEIRRPMSFRSSWHHPLHHSCRWRPSTSPASTRPTSIQQNVRRRKAQKTTSTLIDILCDKRCEQPFMSSEILLYGLLTHMFHVWYIYLHLGDF